MWRLPYRLIRGGAFGQCRACPAPVPRRYEMYCRRHAYARADADRRFLLATLRAAAEVRARLLAEDDPTLLRVALARLVPSVDLGIDAPGYLPTDRGPAMTLADLVGVSWPEWAVFEAQAMREAPG